MNRVERLRKRIAGARSMLYLYRRKGWDTGRLQRKMDDLVRNLKALEKNTVIEISRYPAARETLPCTALDKHRGYLMVVDQEGCEDPAGAEPDVVIIAEDIHGREMLYNTRTGLVQLLTDYSNARFVPCDINLRVIA